MDDVLGDFRLDFRDISDVSRADFSTAIQGAAAVGTDFGPMFALMIDSFRGSPSRAFVTVLGTSFSLGSDDILLEINRNHG